MSEERAQQLAYIPMYIPDIDFQSGEINSLPITKSIDKSVKEIKENLYEHRRENQNEFKEVKKDIADLKSENTLIHTEIHDMKSNIGEIKGDIKVLNTQIVEIKQQLEITRDNQNKWFMVLGVLFSVLTVAFSVLAFFK